jgi:two-component system nitrate/nitrite response regulator NarL
MSDTAADSAVARGLRVLIYAPDPFRRDGLRKLIAEAGHQFVDSLEAADVVLSDGDWPSTGSRPVVAVGGSGTDQAGLLAHDAAASQINAALCAVAAGLTVRSPEAAQPGFAAMNEYSLQTLFTPREMEVLSAIGDGLSNKMIARRLNISLHTVKFHIESLFKKLGVRTRTEALAKARERRHKDTMEL